MGERHEGKEDCEMQEDPMCTYEEAHGIATRNERKARTPHMDPQVDSHKTERDTQGASDPLHYARMTREMLK